MKVETKFSVGDTVWIMKNNKPIEDEVTALSVSAWGWCPDSTTYVTKLSCGGKYTEEDNVLHLTRNELMLSVFGETE